MLVELQHPERKIQRQPNKYMRAKSLFLTMAFLLLLSVVAFGQSSATKSKSVSTCDHPAKVAVWRWLLRQDWFEDFGKCSERLDMETIKLGPAKGVIVRGYGDGLCGATGNCPTWVLLNRRNKFRIILNVTGIKTVETKQSGKKNQPLVLFRHHMAINEHYLSTFRFTREKFTLVRCQIEVYATDGKRHISKAPSKYCLN